MILEMETGRFVGLQDDLAVTRVTDIFADGRKGPWSIRSAYLWIPAADDLVAVGNLHNDSLPEADPHSYRRNFLRIPLSNPADYSVLVQGDGTEPEIGNAEMMFYRLGHSYLASLGGVAYILRMEHDGKIWMTSPGSVELRALKSYKFDGGLPILPEFATFSDVAAVFAAIEKSRMPVGIFGWDSRLFVVERTPVEGRTRWKILEIDPVNDKIVGSAVIPVSASHLTIVPGKKHWAFIEKGHVISFGNQEIEGALLVPAENFATLDGGDICR